MSEDCATGFFGVKNDEIVEIKIISWEVVSDMLSTVEFQI